MKRQRDPIEAAQLRSARSRKANKTRRKNLASRRISTTLRYRHFQKDLDEAARRIEAVRNRLAALIALPWKR